MRYQECISTEAAQAAIPRQSGSTILDAGLLPVADLAVFGEREGKRPRAVYQAHRWFARRFGSEFRALLIGASIPSDADFWEAYYGSADLIGTTVVDPFVGGGTSVVEAQRLGAHVVGVDIDAVACAITRFETRLAICPDLLPALGELQRLVGEDLKPYYQTIDAGGAERTVLHYFWVQVIECGGCGATVQAHPSYQLAYEAEGINQWVFCPTCHEVHVRNRGDLNATCPACQGGFAISPGPVVHGTFCCPACGGKEALRDYASRTGQPPVWQMFATEVLDTTETKGRVPIARRSFQAANEVDATKIEAASAALAARRSTDQTLRYVPERAIPTSDRSDPRPACYGYTRYRDLFSARQLLHLSLLGEAIDALEEPVREAMVLAFSDHLATNCMLTHYAFGWRRLAPLFSVRAYRHVTRPVEINPWLDGTGRGTFPNTVRQVQRAADWARRPQEPLVDGGFKALPPVAASPEGNAVVYHTNSERLDILQADSADIVLTDPPYFDNIAYSELSDFYLPWLQLFGLAPSDDTVVGTLGGNLAAKRRDDAARQGFEVRLHRCFMEVARILRPSGRLIFTYQHATSAGWLGLATALRGTGLKPLQLFPMLGDGTAGLHKHKGSVRWDAVFVCERSPRSAPPGELTLRAAQVARAHEHAQSWMEQLSAAKAAFSQADRASFTRACLVAASLGLFEETETDPVVALRRALDDAISAGEPVDAVPQ